MKKLLGILAIGALVASAFAQGTIVFNNNTGLVQEWTSATDSTPINVPKSGGEVQLFYAPIGTALTPLGVMGSSGYTLNTYNGAPITTLAAFLGANPGWTSGGITPMVPVGAGGQFNGSTVTLAGIAGGASAEYYIIGWVGNSPSWDAAYTAGVFAGGSSTTLTTATGNPGATPPGSAVPLENTFNGLLEGPVVVTVIPEPTSFALAGLGLAALLVFRRRNS